MSNVHSRVRAIYYWLLDLVLPPVCSECARVGHWLCERCALALPLFEGPMCEYCGRPHSPSGICPVCRESPLSVQPIRSAFLFEGAIREALHALKYQGGQQIVETLGEPLRRSWQQSALESDLLIPVPLHPDRERRRGYNQAQLLARALGWRLGLPVASRLLVRARDTVSQTRLDREARQRNVEGAFVLQARCSELAGMRVTLIDDVATTGATLNACAVVLRAAGVKEVNAFTLARAP